MKAPGIAGSFYILSCLIILIWPKTQTNRKSYFWQIMDFMICLDI